jgi:hypothetical protein
MAVYVEISGTANCDRSKGHELTFRFKVSFPTGRRGTSACGQILVTSKMFQRNFSASAGSRTWTYNVQDG